MKKIEFKKISIKNYLSIGNIPLEIDFSNGINIITGVNLDKASDGNGVGKSSIISALYYAIFGEPFDDLKNDDIVNKIFKKKCEVKLDFDYIENNIKTSYTIERGIAPSYCTLFKNAVQDKTLSTIPQTNDFIKKLISSNQTVFRNTIIMTANNATPFMAMKKVMRRDFVEGIIRLEVFKQMLNVAREKYVEVMKDYESSVKIYETIKNQIKIYKDQSENFKNNKNKQLDDLNIRKTSYEKDLVEETNKIFSLPTKEYIENLIKKLSENNKKYSETKEKATLYITTFNTNTVLLNNNVERLSLLNNELTILQTQLGTLSFVENKDFTSNLNKEIEEATAAKNNNYKETLDLEHIIKTLTADIKKTKEIGGFCPKCQRPYDTNDVTSNENFIKVSEETILNTNIKIKSLSETYVTIEKTIKEKQLLITQYNNFIDLTNKKKRKQEEISEILTKNEEYNKNITENKNNKEILEKELIIIKETIDKDIIEKDGIVEKINKNKEFNNNIKNITNNITVTTNDIKKVEEEKNTFEDLLIAEKTKLDNKNKEIDVLKEKIGIYDLIKFAVSEEGIKAFIVKKIINILNERINYYLKKLEGNCNLIFNEYFEDKIVNDTGVECSYFNFSGGERKRIDLACVFAFMDLRRIQGDVEFNIVFFDELIDSALSTNGSKLVFEILKERLNKFNESSYIVTHRKENLKNEYINNIIFLEKFNGITKLGKYVI